MKVGIYVPHIPADISSAHSQGGVLDYPHNHLGVDARSPICGVIPLKPITAELDSDANCCVIFVRFFFQSGEFLKMELFTMFPHESGIVMQRGVEMGMIFSSALIAHCLYVLHCQNRAESTYPYMDVFFELTLLMRVICAIPRPYIWLNTWKKFVRARSQPTPQLVTQALVGIYNNQNTFEKFLLHFYYGWLFITSLIALFTPYRTQFTQSVWHHLLLNFGFIVLHRVVCIAIFYYLVNSDMSRGVHLTILESESTLVSFSKDIPSLAPSGDERTKECSICYGEYGEEEQVRILRCGHDYHMRCIDEWLTKHRNRCPMCLHVVGTTASY